MTEAHHVRAIFETLRWVVRTRSNDEVFLIASVVVLIFQLFRAADLTIQIDIDIEVGFICPEL